MTTTLSLAATQKACYFPNGDLAPATWTPCNAAAETSHCCLATHICLDNSYCYSQDDGTETVPYTNRIWRGACTDQSWRSSACPYYCTDLYSQGGKTIALVRDLKFGLFCCGQSDGMFNGTHCKAPTHKDASPFTLTPGRAIQNRLTGDKMLPATTSSPAVSTQDDTSSPHKNCATTAVGVGAGVPLGILLLLAVIWALYLRRQIRRLSQLPLDVPAHKDERHAQTLGAGGFVQKIPEASGIPMLEMNSDAHRLEMDAR